jgi:LuxR family transcriptional regulator, maltose regulon positive regulatory protein
MPRVRQSRKSATQLAKLNPPRLPAIVERPRLYRLLDQASKRPVIWITAPPGFGKTTLVASYLRARKIHPLWYQVDEGDGDLATFFHYLVLAATQAAPRSRTPLPHLTPEYLQGLPTFTRRFFEGLYVRLKPPAFLILDNYQEVSLDSLFHQTVALGIEVLPEKIGMIVMSRALPPSALARLQAVRQIHFISEESLRLTKEESRSIVRLHTQSPSKLALAEILHDRVQGWPAGLVLQLEQVEPSISGDTVISGGTPQVIFEYFAREVLHRLSPEQQRFLLQTAFLPEILPTIAEKLTGQATTSDILSHLYQSRYFTERRMATTDPVYQYHPLFREFLQTQAKAVLSSRELSSVQRTAASLLEEAERFEDAVTLYYGARHLDEIVRLLLSQAPTLLQQGRTQALEGWLKLIPAEQYDQAPWLLYWLGACRQTVDPVESEDLFARAFERFKAQNDRAGMLMAWAGAESSIQYSLIDISKLDHWIDIMLDIIKTDESFPSKEIETQVTFCMLNALKLRRPQPVYITPWIDRAKDLLEGEPGIEKYSALVAQLGSHFTWLGDLQSADKYSRVLKAAAECEDAEPSMRISYCLNRATVDWSLGEPAEALRLVEQGLAISKATGVHVFDGWLLGVGATISLLQHDVASAEQYLKRVADLVMHPAHLIRATFLFHHAWGMRINGDLKKAWELIREALTVKGVEGNLYAEGLINLAAAELLHGLGDDQQARQYLNHVKSVGKEMKSFQLQFMVHLMESQFAFDQGRESLGLAELRQAFAMGRQRSFSYYFWWLSKSMARLCAKALEADIEVEYVQDLIRKTKLVPDPDTSTNGAWPWPVKIYTLGWFEIHLDGKPLPPRRKAPYRVLALLKAMIAMGGRDIPVSRLIDALWPDAEGDMGEETFHKTLQRLRHLLSLDQLIQVRGKKISLNREICWVDALVFDDLLSHGYRDKKQLKDDTTWMKAYELAVGLYRGHFLGDDEPEAWARVQQDRLRRKFLDATERLRVHWTESGDSRRAMDMTRRTHEVELVEA